jgi:hypothetical protein
MPHLTLGLADQRKFSRMVSSGLLRRVVLTRSAYKLIQIDEEFDLFTGKYFDLDVHARKMTLA